MISTFVRITSVIQPFLPLFCEGLVEIQKEDPKTFFSQPPQSLTGGCVRHRPWTCTWFMHSCTFLPVSARQQIRGMEGISGLWEQRGDSEVTHLRADTVLLWYLWQELLAEAAVPEPTLAQDTGNEEMGPLSYVITGTQPAECMFVHAYVCVSVCKTDRLTDCRSAYCMHDLSHSSPSNSV